MKFLDHLAQLTIPTDFYSLEDVYYQSVSPGYTSYKINNDVLLNQLTRMFAPILKDLEGMFVQKIDKNFNDYKHKDPRKFAINYILEPGGDNVITTFYKNFSDVDCAVNIPAKKWHYFDASKYHKVDNVTSTRISITLSIKQDPSIETIDWLNAMASPTGIEPVSES